MFKMKKKYMSHNFLRGFSSVSVVASSNKMSPISFFENPYLVSVYGIISFVYNQKVSGCTFANTPLEPNSILHYLEHESILQI